MGSEYVYRQCDGGRVVSLDTHKQQLGCPQECAQEAKGQVFAVSVRDGLEEATVWNGRSRSSVGRAGNLKDPVVVGGSGINSNTILRSVPEVQVSLRPEP
jgi:hypothetical protein